MPEYAIAESALDFGTVTNKETSDLTPAEWLRTQNINGVVIAAHLPYDISASDDVWLSRKHWETKQRGLVLFVAVPRNKKGGGSNPLMLVASLAVVAFAPWAAGAILGTTSGLAYTALAAGIGIAGQSIVSKAFGSPTAPTNAALPAASPTYSSNVRGNQARSGESIPVQYGEVTFPPEFIQSPYVEFENDDEYFCGLYCLGQGSFDVVNAGFGAGIDLPFSELEDLKFEVINKNNYFTNSNTDYHPKTIFSGQHSVINNINRQEPIVVSAVAHVATDVSNFELEDTSWSRWFVATPRFATSQFIQVNIIVPGLYYAEDNGSLSSRTITLKFEVKQIDDEGNDLTGALTPMTIPDLVITGNTVNTLKRSHKFLQWSGRYKVRVRRIETVSTNQRLNNKSIIHSIISHNPSFNLPDTCSYLAVRVKANGQLSGNQNNQLYVKAKRVLPKLDAAGMLGFDPSDARYNSPQSAVADMLRSHYGLNAGGAVDSEAHLDYLPAVSDFFNMTWALEYPATGLFNFRFDSPTPLMDAITMAMKPAMASPYIMGGSIYFASPSKYDQVAQRVIEGVSSFSENIAMPRNLQSGGLEVEYWDSRYNRSNIVLCKPELEKPLLLDRMQLYGVDNINDAYAIGMKHLFSAMMQVSDYSYETDIRGRIPFPQDRIDLAFVHWAGAQTGYISNIVLDISGNYILSLTDDPEIDYSGSGVVARMLIKASTGQKFYFTIDAANQPTDICQVVIDGSQSDIAALAPFMGDVFGTVDRPLEYSIIEGDEPNDLTQFRNGSTLCRVSSIEPAQQGKVKINAVIDSPLLYQTFGFAAETSTLSNLTFNTASQGFNMAVTVMPIPTPTNESLTMRVSWQHQEGATGYEVAVYADLSVDSEQVLVVSTDINEAFIDVTGLESAAGVPVDLSSLWVGVRGEGVGGYSNWYNRVFNLIG